MQIHTKQSHAGLKKEKGKKKNTEVLAFSVLQTNKSFVKGHNNVTR